MWKFENVEEGIVIEGSREEIKEQLNIHTVYIEEEDREELFDPYQPSHWKIIVDEYNLTGDDD